MQRIALPVIAVLLTCLGAGSVSADINAAWHHFWTDFKAGYHRNVTWPNPHVHLDRAAVQAPLAMQIHNGWRLQNLLHEHHFDNETGELNNAGQSRLRWILTQAPEQHRNVHVQYADIAELTEARVASVTRAASHIAPDQPVPPVAKTHLQPRPWSAHEINQMHVRYYSSFPPPRLPQASNASGGSN